MISHENLENYIYTNVILVKEFGFDLEYLEEMPPWEREAYLLLLQRHIEEQNEKMKEEERKYKA